MAERHRTKSVTLAIATALVTASASAQSPPPSTPDYVWPLYEIDRTLFQSTGQVRTSHPRPAVWSSHIEFQEFGSGIDPHPGIDIRGGDGDAVIFPRAGTLVHVSNFQHCTGFNAGVQCRLWVRTSDDKHIYYLGHVDLGHTPVDDVRRALRQKVETAADGSGTPAVAAQELAGQLVTFRVGQLPWDHLHLGVFDRQDRYASLDPLAFLIRSATGQDGSTLAILDDEAPVVKNEQLVADTALVATSAVNPSGLCGLEVRGAIDIKADIKDKFFTDRPAPRTFPGENLPATMGVKGARYVVRNLATPGPGSGKQWFESPLGCAGTGCGLWRVRFRATDRALFNDDAGFFAWLGGNTSSNGAPEFAGGDFAPQLWDLGLSANDHESASEVPIIHILTNGVTEASGSGGNDAWIPTDGRYVVTLEAWDFGGNVGGKSLLVTVNNAGATELPVTPTKGFREAIVKDHAGDFGQIPSSLAGAVWWDSEDIIVADAGTSVTCATPARGLPVVVGATYDVYVRVHNTGCQPVDGVRASVHSATPGTMLTDVRPISAATTYDGTPVTVPAGGCQVIGPFPWAPTQADLGGPDGHRCLLAAIDAAIDHGPAEPLSPASWVPTNDDNIAQRNLQVSALEFFIRNATASTQSSELVIDMGTFPTSTAGAFFELLVEDPAVELEPLWQGSPNAQVSRDGTNVVVRVLSGGLTLPAFMMPGVSARHSEVRFGLPSGSGPHFVRLSHKLGGTVVGGMTFKLSGPGIIS